MSDYTLPKNGNAHPLVSIITPCYNAERYIGECIESILAQDYDNIEHIIQDGASADSTVSIIEKYQASHQNKIWFVSEPDDGQSDGLDKAIQRARGDILLVLNADDSLLPSAVTWGVQQMVEHPDMAVIYGDVYIMNEHGHIVEKYTAQDYDFAKLLCIEVVPPAQAAFIRSSSFAEVGYYADRNLDTCPDYEMWVRIGLRYPMLHVPNHITKYRRWHQPFDSKSVRTVQRFLNSKKLVMNRVFDSPRMPADIKLLRNRAYSGLALWGAMSMIGQREYSSWQEILKLLWTGLRYGHVLLFFKRISRKLLHLLKRSIMIILRTMGMYKDEYD